MKQMILFCLAISFFTALHAQKTDSTISRASTDYLKKSKKQKTAGWVLLGGGALLTTVGIAVGAAETTVAVLGSFSGQYQSTSSAGGILTLTGLAAMAGSIPLFIASGKNRRRAGDVSFRMENTTQFYRYAFSQIRYPSIAIQIRL